MATNISASANITSSGGDCGYAAIFSKNAYWGIYAYFMPCFLVLGLLGRGLSLVAFYQQVKVEAAYLFQIFAAASELVEVVTSVLYTSTRFLWSGVSQLSQPWFKSCYLCMFVDAHLSNPLQMSAGLCSLLCSLCMTLDRTYALAWPIKYTKKKNRKKQQWVIFGSCIFISCLAAFPVLFIFYPIWNESTGMYAIKYNDDWGALISIGTKFYVIFKLVVALGLVLANAILALIYKIRMRKRAKIAQKANKNQNVSKDSEESITAGTLFWLTFIQSMLDALSVSGTFAYNLVGWISNVVYIYNVSCIQTVMAPFVDFIKAVANLSDFYVAFALMPSFRSMVIKNVKKGFGTKDNKVTSSVNSNGVSKTTKVSIRNI